MQLINVLLQKVGHLELSAITKYALFAKKEQVTSKASHQLIK